MIHTVCGSQAEALRAISQLHNGGRMFEADFTWGHGSFWKDFEDLPRIRVDIERADPRVNVIADVRALPFPPGGIESAVFDPPFIHAHGKDSVMGQRFSSYPSQNALNALYEGAAVEMARVIRPGGLLVWKCQDIVESGKQVWNHVKVHDHGVRTGLIPIDLMVLVARSTIVGWNHRNQQHARKTHSYFWVFRSAK